MSNRIKYDDTAAKRLETEVGCLIARISGYYVRQTQQDNVVDLEIFADPIRAKRVAIAEVKRRHMSIEAHPTVHISYNKIRRINTEAHRLGCRAILIVVCFEGAFFFEIPRTLDTFQKTEGGRRDRNDPHDTELMIHFPTDQFIRLKNFA
jgi:hypothetical protein